MRDGSVRKLVKRIAAIRYRIDLAATRAIRRLQGESFFELRGECKRCGCCCETPMIKIFALFYHLRSIRWATVTWQRVVNGFTFIGEDRKTHTLIFRCTHWDPATKLCDSYQSRPGMCRDYPRLLIWSTNPKFLEGCGYYAVHRNADRIREALEELDLPPERLKDLKERLHARE